MSKKRAADDDIDDELYNRQRYVLGDDAMKRLRQHHVLIIGAGGIGIEIAKNIVLAGVNSVTLQDSKLTTMLDLGTQYFLQIEDIGKNRAERSIEKLRALNEYVKVHISTDHPSNWESDRWKDFTCVVLTEGSLDQMKEINEHCRKYKTVFIAADVYGNFSRCYVDCGTDKFIVFDKDGEQLKEVFISHISREGVVTVAGDERHPFQDNDLVTFRELVGLEELNGCQKKIKDLSINQFSIGDISTIEGTYQRGGIAREVKQHIELSFTSLDEQLNNPRILMTDGSDYWTKQSTHELPLAVYIHGIMLAVSHFKDEHEKLPNPKEDQEALKNYSIQYLKRFIQDESRIEQEILNNLVKCFCYSCSGSFAPLCSAMGGFVGQQVLTSLTGKFKPLEQWFYLDAYDLMKEIQYEKYENETSLVEDRYQSLRLCIGTELVETLAKQRIFMVGCGAIGCELLKLYALLGVGRKGEITITDHDHIEKSNLNRQFLFRKIHLNQPKSSVAAEAAREMNSDLKITSHTRKVGAGNLDLCTDAFISKQTIIVNALDNVEARRYMDSRCVTNKKPLLESGTMGPKGHTFVVVPLKSESYSSQNDPIEKDVPYCNVKSFPANIEHCTIWAREKFESTFNMKPSLYNHVMLQPNILTRIENGETIDGLPKVYKFSERRCLKWSDCLRIARIKFEKYFSNKARDLLHCFPADMVDDKGAPYWKLPKRAPTPLVYSNDNQHHYDFVIAMARLFQLIYGVKVSNEEMKNVTNNKTMISEVTIDSWKPRNKVIITDPNAHKPSEPKCDGDVTVEQFSNIQQKIADLKATAIPFEKDDNLQIDFIAAATNLRAQMYGLELGDRFEIKRIAGRIVPAIGTTTATVSGLISIELVKLCLSQIKDLTLSAYRNFYINIALPHFIASEPMHCTTQKIGKFEVSIWSNFEIHGYPEQTLQQFIDEVAKQYSIKAALISEGVKSIYAPWMPKANQQLTRKMVELIPHKTDITYVDLVVLPEDDEMESQNDPDSEVNLPPIRYYFNS